jgi:phosphatidate cytidylyltransferase
MELTEFQKRAITTLIMLPTVFLGIYLNKVSFSILLGIIFFISLYEWFLLNQKKINLITSFGFFIILASFISAYYLRGDKETTTIFFLWIISICIFSDVGGYVCGKYIGQKKITKISPNKTYAGMYGSFIFSIFPILIIFILNLNFIKFHKILSLWEYIFLSLFLSLICQIGDIAISYFKRKNNVKDTGKILPGHGGILDRIDGLLFVMIFSGILKFNELI